MSLLKHGEQNATISIKRYVMCNVLLKSKHQTIEKKFEDLYSFLAKKSNCPDISKHKLIKEVRNFKMQFRLKWEKYNRHEEAFLEREKSWLSGEYRLKLYVTGTGGRPIKNFVDCCDGSKRRKTADLRSTNSADELTYAAQMKLRSDHKISAANHVLQVMKPIEISTDENKKTSEELKVTPVQALSLMIEAQLSKKQYNIIRNYAPGVFPCYNILKKEKKSCYPQNITYTDIEAEVPLQPLLDHTATRLLQAQEEVITSVNPENEFTLHVKWGFDGSSSHTQYMQKFVSEESDDKYMFLTSLVPIRLTVEKEHRTVVIWQNPRPSSPRFCRPIKLQYKKETTTLSKTVKAQIESQISNLIETKVQLKDKEYSIKYKLHLTMVDGKICNSLSDTKSTMRCFLCEATSKDFNDLDKIIQRPVKKDYLLFGISVLHAWIRLFESLLHLAYKLNLQSWRVTKEVKAQVEENKKRIQDEFKQKLYLIIDQPKPGFGNTNNGNVARKFFQNYQLSAEITGLNEELIRRYYMILQTISSGYKIDTDKFKNYCLHTAELYVSLYSWCPMTTTVHKILIHGSEIISEHLIPIGSLSEEAQEARNKDFKCYRERFSRKTSRVDNMIDVFNRLLISSDPIITCSRSLPVMDRKTYDLEAIEMFLSENLMSS